MFPRPVPEADNKTIYRFAFMQKPDSNGRKHICKLCPVLPGDAPRSFKCDIKHDYSNLMSHIRHHHPDIHDRIHQDTVANQGPTGLFVSPKAKKIHGWLYLLIKKNLPLTFVSDPTIRDFIKLDPISYGLLKKYMTLLTDQVQDQIMKLCEDSNTVGLIMDGWDSGNGTHYMGLFCILENMKCLLLAISTTGNILAGM